MSTWHPTTKIPTQSQAILKQYCAFAHRADFVSLDFLERSDPWEKHAVGYFINFTDPNNMEISRALMPIRWSWCTFGRQVCEDWYVLKCKPDDPLVQQWRIIQSSFREFRLGIVPDLRIYDNDIYYVIAENVSYQSSWIRNREVLDDLCSSFRNAVDQRMVVDGVRVPSK